MRGTLESHSITWLKKELEANYVVLNSHHATPDAYKIASGLIKEIEEILRARQC